MQYELWNGNLEILISLMDYWYVKVHRVHRLRLTCYFTSHLQYLRLCADLYRLNVIIHWVHNMINIYTSVQIELWKSQITSCTKTLSKSEPTVLSVKTNYCRTCNLRPWTSGADTKYCFIMANGKSGVWSWFIGRFFKKI